MVTKKKKSTKVPHLALHTLILALSFWGTSVRLALIGFIALAVFVLQVLELQSAPQNMSLLSAILIEGQMLVYVLLSFLILDAGYVTIARRYGFGVFIDKSILIASEILLAFNYFLPYFVIVSDRLTLITRQVFLAVLLLLAARIVLGLFYGKAAQK